MARNRTNSFEPIDLAGLIEDSLILLEREMNKYRVSVERYFDPAPRALVNPVQVQQILINLMVNARQAMPNGGRLILKVTHSAEEKLIDLVVRDTGSGIPPEKLRRIFDPFFSTKSGPDASGKGGTGLGLSMCRDIIEAHHGRIRVESTPGKGTAFTLRFPVAKSESIVHTLGNSSEGVQQATGNSQARS
jgi:signal transduction histidine kinase